jgi:hypothetical protein
LIKKGNDEINMGLNQTAQMQKLASRSDEDEWKKWFSLNVL